MPDPNNPVSWDLFYLTEEGIEAHLQLRGATVDDVLSQAEHALEKVRSAGGVARPGGARGEQPEEPVQESPPTCRECGSTMTYREGTSRAGKPYKGYFCPDGDCKGEPVWVND